MRQGHAVARYAALCLLLLGSRSVSYADLLPGIWYEFGFDPNHSPLAAGCQPDDPGGVPCRPGIGSVISVRHRGHLHLRRSSISQSLTDSCRAIFLTCSTLASSLARLLPWPS